jgi:hypothetical protein
MSIVARISIPGGGFGVGELSSGVPEIELDRTVTCGRSAFYYLWVNTPDRRPVESPTFNHPFEELLALDSVSGGGLYRGKKESTGDDLINALRKFDVELLRGQYREGAWELQLGFPDLNQLSRFGDYCIETSNVRMELREVFRAVESNPLGSDLTPRQREALVTAHEAGYYDIPRRASQLDIAERFGLSDQAVSERLRRGESKLIRRHLLDEENPDRDSGGRFR